MLSEKSSNLKYDEDKYSKIFNLTIMNYSNMIKRLSRSNMFANTIIIYYSISLIIISLSGKYFSGFYNNDLAEYFSIVFSVVLLVYSLIIKNSKYSERILKLTNALNSLKNLKRNINNDSLQKLIDEYNYISDNQEIRKDIDFYYTVMSLRKKYRTKKGKFSKYVIEDECKRKMCRDYLSELNVLELRIQLFFTCLVKVIISILPITIIILCFVYKC